MTEEWRFIKGYEGIYEVSNHGIVRSVTRKLPDGRTRKGIVLRPYIDEDGYKHVSLCKNGKMKHFIVHRLVAESFVDNPMNLPQVNHKDETKDNNRYDNLEWCDVSYNLSYGTRQEKVTEKISGERNYAHKLTCEIVKEIRKSYIPGDKEHGQCAMARKYGVCQSVIKNAISGKTWKCVKE